MMDYKIVVHDANAEEYLLAIELPEDPSGEDIARAVYFELQPVLKERLLPNLSREESQSYKSKLLAYGFTVESIEPFGQSE